jgi:hypothetical protein
LPLLPLQSAEGDADDNGSSVGDDASSKASGSVAGAGSGFASDYRRGKRYKKLVKMLTSNKAQASLQRCGLGQCVLLLSGRLSRAAAACWEGRSLVIARVMRAHHFISQAPLEYSPTIAVRPAWPPPPFPAPRSFGHRALAILGFLLVVHVACYVAATTMLEQQRSHIHDMDESAHGVEGTTRVMVDARSIANYYATSQAPTGPWKDDSLDTWVQRLGEATTHVRDSHYGVYLGFESLRRLTNTRACELRLRRSGASSSHPTARSPHTSDFLRPAACSA